MPVSPPSQPTSSFEFPAEYYARPPKILKDPIPRWVPISCGCASLIFLSVLFAGGLFMQRGGLKQFFGFTFTQLQAEAKKIFAPDVPESKRQEFLGKLERVEKGLRDETIPLSETVPLMEDLRDAFGDRSFKLDEVTTANAQLDELLAGPRSSK
jgi:hypothetical protein